MQITAATLGRFVEQKSVLLNVRVVRKPESVFMLCIQRNVYLGQLAHRGPTAL